jgi:hypothetical protein
MERMKNDKRNRKIQTIWSSTYKQENKKEKKTWADSPMP